MSREQFAGWLRFWIHSSKKSGFQHS